MSSIKVIVADPNFLVRKGIASITALNPQLELVAEAKTAVELYEKLELFRDAVVILDYLSMFDKLEDIAAIKNSFPEVKLLGITDLQPRLRMTRALELGLTSHLLKECEEEEIVEAVEFTYKGERFMCGKIVEFMTQEGDDTELTPSMVSCEGAAVSDRELDIIQLVAEGYSNKQIADRLCLSTHTVTTHRKNIMAKLGVANTAGLVLYAVRENLICPNKYLFSS